MTTTIRAKTRALVWLAPILLALQASVHPRDGVWEDVKAVCGEGINLTFSRELAPSVTEDGLILVYMSTRRDEGDLYMATRESTNECFGAPTNLSYLNTNDREDWPNISPNGLTLYFWREGRVFVTTRESRREEFGESSEPQLLVALSQMQAFDVSLTEDGLTMIFSAGRLGPGRLWEMWRDDPKHPFENMRNIAEVDDSTAYSVSVSADGRTIFWGPFWLGSEPGNIRMATRDRVRDDNGQRVPFAAPTTLPEPVNTTLPELTPFVSSTWPRAGAKMYFTRILPTPEVLLFEATWNPSPIPFLRGDANDDGGIDIADPISILNHLFNLYGELSCLQTGDANDDNTVDIADPTYMLNHLFGGGPPLTPPVGDCGMDPTPAENAEDDLTCDAYTCEA